MAGVINGLEVVRIEQPALLPKLIDLAEESSGISRDWPWLHGRKCSVVFVSWPQMFRVVMTVCWNVDDGNGVGPTRDN